MKAKMQLILWIAVVVQMVIPGRNATAGTAENNPSTVQRDLSDTCNALFTWFDGNCAGCIQFHDLSSGEPVIAWSWSFGDGTGSLVQNPLHQYGMPGLYPVMLSIQTAGGCSSDTTMMVGVWNFPGGCQASFIGIPDSLNPLQLGFMDTSSGIFDTWYWDFGDGTYFSGGPDPVHIFPAAGAYEVCLTISNNDSLNPCLDTYCMSFTLGNPGNCEAGFMAVQDTVNSMFFHFYDQSTGLVSEWLWDFGDGTTSVLQNPGHIFPGTGQYPVCLTIMNNNPVSPCLDVFCDTITVLNNLPCDAFFTASEDPADPLTWLFIDQSTGLNITTWEWNFGDGSVSFEQNPVYTFGGPGFYNVCLTIHAEGMGVQCEDSWCEVIKVSPVVLEAAFTWVLDTTPGVMHRFMFFDQTSGNPGSWQWIFADGTISQEQNPTHEFSGPGDWQVCLVAGRTYGNQTVYDTACHGVVSPGYFNLGGVAFLGEIPMNNPLPEQDTGIAYLYRKFPDQLVPVDTMVFDTLGYYWFANVMQGKYVVKLRLTEGSTHAGVYLPAYSGNAGKWFEADPVILDSAGSFTEHISMPALPGNFTGPGTIEGTVCFSGDGLNVETPGEVEIILMNPAGQPLAYTLSGAGYHFSFSQVPLGSYKLYAESAGWYSVTHPLTLDPAAPWTYADLCIYDTLIYGTVENQDNETLLQLWPNPVKDLLNIEFDAPGGERVLVSILQTDGRPVKEIWKPMAAGKNILRVPVEELPPGVYFIKLVAPAGRLPGFGKFIRQE